MSDFFVRTFSIWLSTDGFSIWTIYVSLYMNSKAVCVGLCEFALLSGMSLNRSSLLLYRYPKKMDKLIRQFIIIGSHRQHYFWQYLNTLLRLLYVFRSKSASSFSSSQYSPFRALSVCNSPWPTSPSLLLLLLLPLSAALSISFTRSVFLYSLLYTFWYSPFFSSD